MEGAEGNADEDVVHLSENDDERHQGDNAADGVVSAPAGVQIELNVRYDEAFEEEPLLSEEPEDQQQEQHEDEGAEEEEEEEYEHIMQPATTIRESLTNLWAKYAHASLSLSLIFSPNPPLSFSLSLLSFVYVCVLQRVYTYQMHTTNLFSRLF